MVDVEQHGVDVESRRGQREEVVVHQLAARIAGERCPEWHEVAFVPVDDGRQRFDHAQRSHAWVVECGPGGVAEPQPADDDIERRVGGRCQTECRHRLLAVGDQAGHQPVLADLDLEHVDLERRFETATQADLADLGRLSIEFLEKTTHRHTPITGRS